MPGFLKAAGKAMGPARPGARGRVTIGWLALAALLAVLCLAAAEALFDSPADNGPFAPARAYATFPGLEASVAAGSTAQVKAAKPSSKQVKMFKKAARNFSVELLARSVAARGDNENVTVSPLSVMSTLAMTANGAVGKTGAEMRCALGGTMGMKAINNCLSWYNAKLVSSSKARIRNANSIWYHHDGTLKMKRAFLKTCKKHYSADVKPADFSLAGTVDAINRWAADNTSGMIRRVISSLDKNDRIALLNALYFDARWKVPYDGGSVHADTFTTASGKSRTVKMMRSTENRYIEGDGVRGFVKPYAKGYSYVALLPDEGTSLKEFTSSLDGDTFGALVSKATKQRVRAAMPKHTLSYSNEAMEVQLRAMGFSTAFSDAANFSKMASVSQGTLSIGRVVHKTKVKVNEKGTQAAAVTAAIVKNVTSALDDAKTVTLNRPFVYAIVDNTAKLPIFIGTVNNIGS